MACNKANYHEAKDIMSVLGALLLDQRCIGQASFTYADLEKAKNELAVIVIDDGDNQAVTFRLYPKSEVADAAKRIMKGEQA